MMKKYNIPEDIELKKIFDSIEPEQPSANFTFSVMERIAKETIIATKPRFTIPRLYYFLLIPLLTLTGSTLLLFQRLPDIRFEFQIPDLSIIKTWMMIVFENSLKIFSPAVFSICMASFLLYTLFLVSNNKNLTEKS